MKKITLICSTIFAGILSMGATEVYNYDFESEVTSPLKITNAGWIYDGSIMIVENPLKKGLNESNSVLTFEAQEGIEWWGGPNVEFISTTTTETVRYLYLKVLVEEAFTTDFNIRLFAGTNGEYTDLNLDFKPTRVTALSTEWKEFCYVLDPDITFSTIRINPNHLGSFYVDDIKLTDQAPEIPILKPFVIDFENEELVGQWGKNSNDGEVYRGEMSEPPFNNAGNDSNFAMRAWVSDGTEPKYGGARFNDIYGMTNERARYLHVRYFFQSNEAAWNADPKPLRVFTGSSVDPIESSPIVAAQWHDVTIDLGEETLVKYLGFNVGAWWVSLGVDDVQLDWDPYERADLSSVSVSEISDDSYSIYAQTNGVYVDGINENTRIEIYSTTGMKVKSITLTSPGLISLNSGSYIVKVIGYTTNAVKKLIIR